MTDKIILDTFYKEVKGKKRLMARIKCPDCGKEKESRHDGVKTSITTCCRGCLNRRRERTASFNAKEHYHTVQGRCTSLYHSQKARSVKYGWAEPSYTREELQAWVTEQPNCTQLFADWATNKYGKDFSPSVDRLDDYLPYSLSNIRLVPWSVNNERGRKDRLSGVNTKGLVGVRQLSLCGKVMGEYHSCMEAGRQTGFHNSGIGRAARNNKVYRGYLWELC